MNITRQINNRKIGKSPSQLGEQSIPIYGDKATATSETKPLTWRLAHYDYWKNVKSTKRPLAQ